MQSVPLRWPTKAGYSISSIGLSAIELMLQVYLLELYIIAGLKPSLAGAAIAIAVIWDAVSDPIMGIISDKTPAKSLIGKRVPYLVAGGVLISIAFSFLFSPPADSGQTALFSNLLVWYLVVNTAMTLYGVPHLSLVNDLSRNEQERASLFGWRIILGSVGLLIGIGLPAYLSLDVEINQIADTLRIRQTSGLILGIIATVGCLFTAFTVSRFLKMRSAYKTIGAVESYDPIAVFKHGIRSSRFMFLAFGFIAIAVGRSFNSSLALPYYKNTLKFSEDQIGIVLLVLTLLIIVAAPCWVRLSRSVNKVLLFFYALVSLAVLSAIAYPILPPGRILPVLIVAAFGGVLVASVVLLESLFSDFVEAEKESQSKDVSGAYYGIWRMLSKVARALGIACSGLLLSVIGYEEGSLLQSPAIERSIAWAFGPGVAVFLIIGGAAIYTLRPHQNPESL